MSHSADGKFPLNDQEKDEPQSIEEIKRRLCNDPFTILRTKWGAVPAGPDRFSTAELLKYSDSELLETWTRNRDLSAAEFDVRGWYHTLYKDLFRGKRVLDVGSGLGLDGITFAQHGAEMTFFDLVESNLQLLERVCGLLGLKNVAFHYLEGIESIAKLPDEFDAIYCQGSQINLPFEIMCEETVELLKHLPIGGRWVELAYPEERWVQEGKLPFDKWGVRTDGWAPWIEWYDLPKLKKRLAPAQFDVVLAFNFHNNEFNWFDLVRTA